MRYNITIFTQEKEELAEIERRLRGLTYACQIVPCQETGED